MNNTMKTMILGAAMVLPLASFANEAKSVTQPAVKVEEKSVAKADETKKENHMQLTIEGAKHENTAEIVKLAKEAGAEKASYNSKTNMLSFSGEKFNKEQFTGSLSKALPGVSVKN